jgi:hypothetical protein
MARAPNIVDLFVGDALATARRIKADVAHLRDLGRRAHHLSTRAAKQTKAKISSAIESAADGIIAFEKEWGRRE